jgi:hypothetical protein
VADGAFRQEVFAVVVAFERFAANQIAVQVTRARVDDRYAE